MSDTDEERDMNAWADRMTRELKTLREALETCLAALESIPEHAYSLGVQEALDATHTALGIRNEPRAITPREIVTMDEAADVTRLGPNEAPEPTVDGHLEAEYELANGDGVEGE